ncbi:hypothetical protein K501DRAFT_280340 [Backusella circina FSU 941]|nr:hypothetical protein K501DRAFT_280340 [Backusella circina FSU 941]
MVTNCPELPRDDALIGPPLQETTPSQEVIEMDVLFQHEALLQHDELLQQYQFLQQNKLHQQDDPPTQDEPHQKLSISPNFQLLDISKDKDFMAVLQDDWNLVVYKLKHIDGRIDYVGKETIYTLDKIEGDNPCYMYLSVCSGTGNVALSFAELDKTTRLFTERKPESVYRYCNIYSQGEQIPRSIEFQGRAVYANKKLILVGIHTLDVRDTDTLNLEYFLDLRDIKKGYESLIGGEDTARHAKWAKPVLIDQLKGDDGDKLISTTRHIHSNILVTTYKGNLTRVWSILDGSVLVSFIQDKSEYFMAISENQRFIATYENKKKYVNLYCTKSGLLLYRYLPHGVNNSQANSSVTSVRFCSDRRYIIISGINKDMDNPEQNKSFYEVWSISQERLVIKIEEKNIFHEGVQPFIFESLLKFEESHSEPRNSSLPQQEPENNGSSSSGNSSTTINNSDRPLAKPNSEKIELSLYGAFTKYDSEKLEFQTTLVSKTVKSVPEGEAIPDGTQWEGYQFKNLGTGNIYRQGVLNDICDPLGGDKTLSYVLDRDPEKYILRFGAYMTQLWSLVPIPPAKLQAAKKAGSIFKFGDQSTSSGPYYYNTLSDSDLIFARAYKGNHHGIFSTFRDTWGIFGPNIRFMKNEGHIIITIKKVNDGKNKNQPAGELSWIRKLTDRISNTFRSKDETRTEEDKTIEEELFLPLSKIDSSEADYEFCEIESAFQALHYLDIRKYDASKAGDYSEALFESNRTVLYYKILDIIGAALESEKGKSYFLTVSGSKTMAMLASFKRGRKLLYDIIWIRNIHVNIFSYRTHRKLNENVLTVLMEKTEYDFYNLMLNQILIDYYKKGSGNLSAIMDALLFLQKESFTAQLLSSTKKLSFLPVNYGSIALLNSERQGMLSIKGLQQENTSRVEYLDTFAALEQLERYAYGTWYLFPIHYVAYECTCFCRKASVQDTLKWISGAYHIIVGDSMKESNLAQLCIVPLPYFNSYRSLPEERQSDKKKKKDTRTQFFNGVKYYSYSPFSLLASSIYDNSIFKQGDTVMEMLVQYKWEMFARSRFYFIFFCHLVYYASYSTGVSFPEELFGYTPGTPLTHPSHFVAIVIMFISGVALLIQEYRQYTLNRLEYFRSFYNYVDVAAFTLPVATFILLRTRDPESDVLYAVSSVTTLFLWAHGILRLRVFRTVGNLLEIIIQLVGKIFPIIFIMILIVMGFTNAFIVLLRRQDDAFFRDQFSGNTTGNVTGGVIGNGTSSSNTDLSNESQQDLFKDVFFAYTTVWLFIFGYVDPLFSGNVGNYVMSIILVVLFSFIVVLILFNVVIALMSGTIDEIRKKGNKIWIAHFAAVVSEIELLWGTNATRFSKKNNPTHVYYHANIETNSVVSFL